MDKESIVQFASWGDYGLMGLVIGAMFTLVFTFLRTSEKKDVRHASEVREMLSEERSERTANQQMWRESTDKLSGALMDLTIQLKDGKRDDIH